MHTERRQGNQKAKRHIPILTRLIMLQLFFNHPNHNLIRNQSTGVHNLLRSQSKVGLLRDFLAQHVASGEMAHAEFIANSGSLSTLACSSVPLSWIAGGCVTYVYMRLVGWIGKVLRWSVTRKKNKSAYIPAPGGPIRIVLKC
jgi:hypothetical protein